MTTSQEFQIILDRYMGGCQTFPMEGAIDKSMYAFLLREGMPPICDIVFPTQEPPTGPIQSNIPKAFTSIFPDFVDAEFLTGAGGE